METGEHPLWTWLKGIEKGSFVDDAWDELKRVVQATRNTKKPSSLVMSFAVSRYDLDDDEDYRRDVEPAITTKTQVPQRGHTTMYVTPDDGLVRYDPRQQRMEFVMPRAAEPQPAPVAKQESD